jgi:uncharacterized SAM-binding protein YcdF (DUF218 family)
MVLGGLAIHIWRYGAVDRARQAEVIIVLGGGPEGTTRRTIHAAALYRAGYAPVVLCAGGYAPAGAVSEGARCAQVAVQHGVPPQAIVVEERSLSTEENAIQAAVLLRARGWTEAVLVSDDFHLWRARWMFAREGIRAWTSPAQATTGALALREEGAGVGREVAAAGWFVVKTVTGLDMTRVGE